MPTKKVDLILTKSLSRFARNTVDSLKYIRALKELGIAIIFEKENINTMETESELLITMMSAFAQAESESLSQNVRWGKREAMREGRVDIRYKNLYGYEKGEDDKPKIIPAQAEVVRTVARLYLMGYSRSMLKKYLEDNKIPNIRGKSEWSEQAITSLLTNEKYCGDVLMQKTFRDDCINRKTIKNTGQLPMYLIRDYHEAILDRATFDAIQVERARRNSGKSPSKKALSGRSCYTSKYALSDRLVCGECGTLYRRCVWSRKGHKRIVWRCTSRLDYGGKYCPDSPTIDEDKLQKAILAAINSAMSEKDVLIKQITGAMELELAVVGGSSMSMADIERRLAELGAEFEMLLGKTTESRSPEAHVEKFKAIADEMALLKEKRMAIEESRRQNVAANRRIEDATNAMNETSAQITEWDETLVRQLIESVKILSTTHIAVTLRGGRVYAQKIDQN